MSGSPKITNKVALGRSFFRSSAMCRSAFIRALRTGMRPSLAELRRMGLVIEGAGDQHVEVGDHQLRVPPTPNPVESLSRTRGR